MVSGGTSASAISTKKNVPPHRTASAISMAAAAGVIDGLVIARTLPRMPRLCDPILR
ncbi:MAG: hypothetical protein M5U35_05210 [Roseovarius sp.]|nr:hypothetical protein [Roseovarius sp.]